MNSLLSGDPQIEAQKLFPETVRPLSFAVLVRDFPAISETFVLNRIAGLLKRGHSVDILAVKPRVEARVQQDVHDHHLLDRTFYASLPRSSMISVNKAAWREAVNAHATPYARYLLDMLRSGRSAASVRLFFPDYPKGRQGHYDIILCFFGPSGLKGLELRKLGMKGKLVTTFHGHDLSQVVAARGEDVYDGLFKSGDLFLPVCDFFRQRLAMLGCDDSKIVVQRNGIDVERFSPKRRTTVARSKTRLIMVARLVEKKGIKYAIEAFANAVKLRPNLELNIVGEGRGGESLENLIDRFGLREVVKLRGLKESSEVVGFFASSDIAINTSVVAADGDIDGIPNALKEAMACGLPVIASSIAGIPELVQDGVSGFLIGQADVPAICQRIVQLVDNPDLRFAMGSRGRAFVEREFNIDTQTDREIELYQELVG